MKTFQRLIALVLVFCLTAEPTMAAMGNEQWAMGTSTRVACCALPVAPSLFGSQALMLGVTANRRPAHSFFGIRRAWEKTLHVYRKISNTLDWLDKHSPIPLTLSVKLSPVSGIPPFFSIARLGSPWPEFAEQTKQTLLALQEFFNTPPARMQTLTPGIMKKHHLPANAESAFVFLAININRAFLDRRGYQRKPTDGFDNDAIGIVATWVSVNFSPFRNLPVEDDLTYEIAADPRLTIFKETQTTLARGLTQFQRTLDETGDMDGLYVGLMAEEATFVCRLLKWIGNVAEMTDNPQHVRARAFLSYFIHRFTRENLGVLGEFARQVLQVASHTRQSSGFDHTSIVVVQTGADPLGIFLRELVQLLEWPVDIVDVILTNRMFASVAPPQRLQVLDRSAQEILKANLVEQGAPLHKAHWIVVDTIIGSGGLRSYMRQLVDYLHVHVHFLALYQGPAQPGADYRLARLLDDGFEHAHLSTGSLQAGKPLAVQPTPRPWFHDLVKKEMRSAAGEYVAYSNGSKRLRREWGLAAIAVLLTSAGAVWATLQFFHPTPVMAAGFFSAADIASGFPANQSLSALALAILWLSFRTAVRVEVERTKVSKYRAAAGVGILTSMVKQMMKEKNLKNSRLQESIRELGRRPDLGDRDIRDRLGRKPTDYERQLIEDHRTVVQWSYHATLRPAFWILTLTLMGGSFWFQSAVLHMPGWIVLLRSAGVLAILVWKNRRDRVDTAESKRKALWDLVWQIAVIAIWFGLEAWLAPSGGTLAAYFLIILGPQLGRFTSDSPHPLQARKAA